MNNGRAVTPIEKICLRLGTGFGLGSSPVASGTVGCLLGIPLAWAMTCAPGLAAHIAIAALLSLVAMPICHVSERLLGRKDDGRIVADEYLTFPLCMLGLPFSPEVLLLAFVSNRFFDILKPFPARGLQRIRGGLGVVIDDVIAALYSLAFNLAAVHWLLPRFGIVLSPASL